MTAKRRSRFDVREASGTILAVMGVLLFANVLFALFWIRPHRADYDHLENEVAPQLNQISSRRKQVEAVEAYAAALTKAHTDLAKLRDEVLSTREREMIATQIEVARIAHEFGIALDKIRFENETLDREALERFGIVVPLEGGYGNLRKFVQAVENSKRFLVIERVGLEQGQDGGALLKMNITLATYFHSPRLAVDAAKRPGEA